MDIKELKERQKWTLDQKIDHSIGVIEQFYNNLNGMCYISFSGGKDSTVLLWIARKIFPDIKAVFCNTGNEYPDIVRFVRGIDNVDWIHPEITPKEVLDRYGFPLVSKKVSYMVSSVRKNPLSKQSIKFMGNASKRNPFYVIPNQWNYLINSPYNISSECCRILKKEPFHKYEKQNLLHPILGVMASESKMRETDYIRQGGCNFFGKENKNKSAPLSIWMEKDVWDCIEKYKIKISDIYKKGAKRTGCMFCGYGCHLNNDNRFKLLYDLYPKWYDKFMKYENSGITYREALRIALSVNGNCLPDENNQLEIKFIND